MSNRDGTTPAGWVVRLEASQANDGLAPMVLAFARVSSPIEAEDLVRKERGLPPDAPVQAVGSVSADLLDRLEVPEGGIGY